MFSYGMVLYELLSGQRPALGHHQLQIAKKLSKGIRPVLGQPEEVQFHRLQALMMECWDTKPEKVPGAQGLVPRTSGHCGGWGRWVSRGGVDGCPCSAFPKGPEPTGPLLPARLFS